MVTSGRGLQQDPCPDTQLPLPPRSAPPPGAPNTRKQRPSDGESGPRQHWPGALSELSRMDRRPGIRPPSPQDPCRRHIHPSPRTPRRCPASGSRNLKPKRLGRTPGSAGGVASQGVDHLAGSGPAGVHLHRQSREPCLTWSDSGSSGGRLTGESFGEPGWWSGCLPANAGVVGLIPGSERPPGVQHGNPLQYSYLEKPMDRGAWCATVHGVTQSGTRPSG